ncbi:AraC family transcriptional regulator [Massilia phosphatilytica]|nr:AraC family transcriptional regulator [Massilia phosphatilytica]
MAGPYSNSLNRVMHQLKNIALLVFAGAQSLNVCAAAAVFAAANDVAGKDVYAVRILSPSGGPVTTMSAVTLMTDPILAGAPGDFDTIVLTGGGNEEVEEAAGLNEVRQWILQAASRCRRLASTSFPCTLSLGRLGLLDNIRITTHWSAAALLAERCAKTKVDPTILYVEDQGIWTAAGVTSAIDMTLEMVARDLGEHVANQIAKRFVLTWRRPGEIAQVSMAITVQEKLHHDFRGLIAWMHAHIAEPLDVMALASKAGMSLRNFQRRFKASTGDSPARFLEGIRLEHGRTLLSSEMPIKSIAAQCGYANAQQFAKAYSRHFGITVKESRAT